MGGVGADVAAGRIRQLPSPAGWEVLQEAAGVECKRSLGRDRRCDRYCELGWGPPPPGLRASILELCMFSALCLASPRVLCGRLTLHWILLSYLAPQCGRSCGRAACSPCPAVRGLGDCGRGGGAYEPGGLLLREHSSGFVFRAGRRAEAWTGRGREAHTACPMLCGDSGVPALNGRNVLAPAQCTPNCLLLRFPSDSLVLWK